MIGAFPLPRRTVPGMDCRPQRAGFRHFRSGRQSIMREGHAKGAYAAPTGAHDAPSETWFASAVSRRGYPSSLLYEGWLEDDGMKQRLRALHKYIGLSLALFWLLQ